ncbi:OmpA family protein [Shimia sp.]|uniref:OmpA family protein n=1 Tax=Shimia sp. TaxID=1954381 RepID=UPI00356712BD
MRFCITQLRAGAVTLLLGLTPPPSGAAAPELPVTADRCAIETALTGRRPPACPAPLAGAFGTARGAAPVAGFPRAAAAPGSLEEERGYFVRFAFDSDRLTADYTAHLDRLSAVLKGPALTGSCLKLVGHADSVGAPAYNLRLSRDRAAQVVAYLVARGGLAARRILTEARGESQLLPGLPGPHPRNRRVEILARAGTGDGCR